MDVAIESKRRVSMRTVQEAITSSMLSPSTHMLGMYSAGYYERTKERKRITRMAKYARGACSASC